MIGGGRQQRAGDGEFLISNVFPWSRDTLTRGFLIEKRLLTPSPDAGRGADAERKVELERTHAKTAKDAKEYRGGAGESV